MATRPYKNLTSSSAIGLARLLPRPCNDYVMHVSLRILVRTLSRKYTSDKVYRILAKSLIRICPILQRNI